MKAYRMNHLLAAALAALLAVPAFAAPAAPAAKRPAAPAASHPEATATPSRLPQVPRVEYTAHTLPNGLRVFLVRDTSAPVVSVALAYNVGSFVEPVGRTGFAHLFEHMMFQGSENVAKAEHSALVTEAGGTMNAGTAQDFTVYYNSVPANQLELALFLEADRMGSLDVSQVNLDNQREVVKEERRMRYENQPYGTMIEKLLDLAYTKSPYKHPPIGSMEDLNAADLAYVRRFFQTFYAPNNAAMAIVGDFQPERAMELVNKYFAGIPRGPLPELPSLEEPPQTEERRLTFTDPLAPLPSYIGAWHIPAGTDPDAPALEVLGNILGGDKSSRLWQSLVEQKQVAASVSASGGAGRGPDLFSVSMAFAPGQDVAAAEDVLYREIERVREDGVTMDEIRKTRTQYVRDSIAALRSSMHRAQTLAINSVVYNEPDRINAWVDKILAVTPEDVQRVARKYLVPTNRVVIIAMPPQTAGATAVTEGREAGQ